MFRFLNCIRFWDPPILFGGCCLVLFHFCEHEYCQFIFGLEGFCHFHLVPKTSSEASWRIWQFRLANCLLAVTVERPFPQDSPRPVDYWVQTTAPIIVFNCPSIHQVYSDSESFLDAHSIYIIGPASVDPCSMGAPQQTHASKPSTDDNSWSTIAFSKF